MIQPTHIKSEWPYLEDEREESGAQAISITNREPEISGIVEALLAKLEKDKPSLNIGPEDQAYCENFALTVFSRADKVDRAEKADRTTAKAFYAASIFIEVRALPVSSPLLSLPLSLSLSPSLSLSLSVCVCVCVCVCVGEGGEVPQAPDDEGGDGLQN